MSDPKEKAQDDSDDGSEGTRTEAPARKPKTTIGEQTHKICVLHDMSNFFSQLATDVASRREKYSSRHFAINSS